MSDAQKYTPGPWKAIFEYKYCPRVLIGEPIEFDDKSGFHQRDLKTLAPLWRRQV